MPKGGSRTKSIIIRHKRLLWNLLSEVSVILLTKRCNKLDKKTEISYFFHMRYYVKSNAEMRWIKANRSNFSDLGSNLAVPACINKTLYPAKHNNEFGCSSFCNNNVLKGDNR